MYSMLKRLGKMSFEGNQKWMKESPLASDLNLHLFINALSFKIHTAPTFTTKGA